ncbi:MAG: hypothetical protein ACRC7R_10805, partial [Sarcina sp.]
KTEIVQTVNSEKNDDTYDQLNYAIQEMTDSINLLDNADFTNQENHDRMTAYATAALNRVRGFQEENIADYMIDHIQWIEESGDEIRSANYSILKLLTAINNVKAVFNGENETLENKENVINTLNEVISHEVVSYGLNQNTLRSASNILHHYNDQLENEQASETKEAKRDEATYEQLNYAIQEMTDAINLLDNADFTNQENHDRMTAYATAALERVRGFQEENISQDMVDHIEWIEESGDEIRDANYNILRLLVAINNAKTVFNGENETLENKKNVVNTLNEVISHEAASYGVNQNTLRSATNILHTYATEVGLM